MVLVVTENGSELLGTPEFLPVCERCACFGLDLCSYISVKVMSGLCIVYRLFRGSLELEDWRYRVFFGGVALSCALLKQTMNLHVVRNFKIEWKIILRQTGVGKEKLTQSERYRARDLHFKIDKVTVVSKELKT